MNIHLSTSDSVRVKSDISNLINMLRTHVPCPHDFEYRGITWNSVTTVPLLKRVENFEFRPDDVVLATFPRSGTTLTQEIIWQIVNHDKIEKDMESESLLQRFPFLEFDQKIMGDHFPYPIDVLNQMTTKRLIKTHVPYFMLKDQLEKVNPKIVVVMRNPKDCATSFFNLYSMDTSLGWKGDWEDFLSMFLSGKAGYGDFFSYNLQWWSLRDRENVLIVKYEDLLCQRHQEIRRIAGHLGYALNAEEVEIIVHNTDFNKMKAASAFSNPLFRKGICGDWKSTFTVSQNEFMNSHIAEKMAETDLGFKYE